MGPRGQSLLGHRVHGQQVRPDADGTELPRLLGLHVALVVRSVLGPDVVVMVGVMPQVSPAVPGGLGLRLRNSAPRRLKLKYFCYCQIFSDYNRMDCFCETINDTRECHLSPPEDSVIQMIMFCDLILCLMSPMMLRLPGQSVKYLQACLSQIAKKCGGESKMGCICVGGSLEGIAAMLIKRHIKSMKELLKLIVRCFPLRQRRAVSRPR